ncbi:MAG: heat-inducible transcriptional repressor HrcA [Gammaproteobacteria bacterium]|nr:heat-inducible transcriptional repressor HrcA [Gammaproteobacteria bacterium]
MPTKQETLPIPERAQQILRLLIEEYIRSGQPVGSRTLSQMGSISFSSATIRNVMGDLEDMGFLTSPHTSAGRIPTAQGYRFFVDKLVRVSALDTSEIKRFQANLEANLTPEELLKTASNYLSQMTHMAGIITIPRQNAVIFDHIEFIALSDQRVLVVLITNDREVQNRIIKVDRDFSRAELEYAANYVNREYVGMDLTSVRDKAKTELESARADMHDQMSAVIDMAGHVLMTDDNTEKDAVIVEGQTNLMTFEELSDVELLKKLFDTFNQKRDILHLLENCIAAEGVSIFIGQETGHQIPDECSIVTAPYNSDGNVIGMLGVIGPTRMAYDRIIPIVDVTSKLLGAALNFK